MRVFSAIYPSPETVEAVLDRLPPGFRHSSPDRWHITLAFHPDVSPSRVETLEERLEAVARDHQPFTVRLAAAGRFGPVSWLGVEGEYPDDTADLLALARAARRAATGAHITTDRRPYDPHLTLARDDGALANALHGYEGPLWPVEEIRLINSHLGPRPVHEVLAAYELGS
jgi:2'-5' RNA ligase